MKHKIYNKHLALDKRNIIEQSLNEGKNFTEISYRIFKDPTTVSKEIRNRRTEVKSLSYTYRDKRPCPKIVKPPYVCNGCPSRSGCRKTRYYYYALEAEKEYRKNLSESRTGINMNPDEFQELDNIIKEGIELGHSFYMIITNNKDKISCGKRTLYNYQEQGYLSTKNIDLPRKVRYKRRKQKKDVVINKTKLRENRTHDDFLEYIGKNSAIDVVEMDTVEGTKGESVLLTLLFRKSNFMIAIKLENKDSECVSNFFIDLKEKLGYELFYKLFPIILTDNGSEFSQPLVIENNGKEVEKTKLFYCNPGASWQKGSLENNHEYIRRYIPKGKTFDKYNQDDITLMINHINSVPRDILNDKTPYEISSLLLNKKLFKILKLKQIKRTEVNLKRSLFKTNN